MIFIFTPFMKINSKLFKLHNFYGVIMFVSLLFSVHYTVQGSRDEFEQHKQMSLVDHLEYVCRAVRAARLAAEDAEVKQVALDESVARLDRVAGLLERYCDVQFIWKVEGFREKFELAKSGKKLLAYYTHIIDRSTRLQFYNHINLFLRDP